MNLTRRAPNQRKISISLVLCFSIVPLFEKAIATEETRVMHLVLFENEIEIGARFQFDERSHSAEVWKIVPGSAADKVGIKIGDRIVSGNRIEFSTLRTEEVMPILHSISLSSGFSGK